MVLGVLNADHEQRYRLLLAIAESIASPKELSNVLEHLGGLLRQLLDYDFVAVLSPTLTRASRDSPVSKANRGRDCATTASSSRRQERTSRRYSPANRRSSSATSNRSRTCIPTS